MSRHLFMTFLIQLTSNRVVFILSQKITSTIAFATSSLVNSRKIFIIYTAYLLWNNEAPTWHNNGPTRRISQKDHSLAVQIPGGAGAGCLLIKFSQLLLDNAESIQYHTLSSKPQRKATPEKGNPRKSSFPEKPASRLMFRRSCIFLLEFFSLIGSIIAKQLRAM